MEAAVRHAPVAAAVRSPYHPGAAELPQPRPVALDLLNDLPREWLETDGLGGFATGTVPGHRTRRYHSLLCTSMRPPVGRVILVNGLEVWLEGAGGVELLSTQVYDPGIVHPDGYRRVESFTGDPWPTWRYRLSDGSAVEHELFVPRGRPLVALRWTALPTEKRRTLCVRPLLSGREYHQLHAKNEFFRFDAEGAGDSVRWRPYADLPSVRAISNGRYDHAPQWYFRFIYLEERRRGLDSVEDLASPGVFRFDFSDGEAVLLLSAGDVDLGGGAVPRSIDTTRCAMSSSAGGRPFRRGCTRRPTRTS